MAPEHPMLASTCVQLAGAKDMVAIDGTCEASAWTTLPDLIILCSW